MIWVALQKYGWAPKMDGENNGSKPYEQMDDLGIPLFLETPIYFIAFYCTRFLSCIVMHLVSE